MRIGCLQFSPVRGDVDNNLSRADSVLLKATDADKLDVILLPELAFTGYNFASRHAIQPFLEPSLSGISSLWARTAALRHDCHVALGYPEKVDASGIFADGPGFYNSLMMVSREGETMVNYRKTHLFTTDETWAMDGSGFAAQWVPGVGQVAVGICADINPHPRKRDWDAFEFAYHVLECDADVALISMAWVTGEDAHSWSRTPHEPDMESLSYWIARLEPLIRAETEHEILVVIANRTGTDGDMVFAGTSTVLGFQAGEVKLYGLMGRGEKGLLVVDTDSPPMGKLVYRPEDMTSRAMSPIEPPDQDLPGLIPNPAALHPMSPVSGDEAPAITVTSIPEAENSPNKLSQESPSILTKDPKKLGVVPEQDEAGSDDESKLIAEWQSRLQAEATSDSGPAASPPSKHQRALSAESSPASASASASAFAPSFKSMLHRRGSPFGLGGHHHHHTRHQSLDALMERVAAPKTRQESPLAASTKPKPPRQAAKTKTKPPQPKLKLQTDPDVLLQMEDELYASGGSGGGGGRERHPYALSAVPGGPGEDVGLGRAYPQTAGPVEPGRGFGWRQIEATTVADPVAAVTAASAFTSQPQPQSRTRHQASPQSRSQSQSQSQLQQQPQSHSKKPKLSIATSNISHNWKKTPSRDILSAIDRPAPAWPDVAPAATNTPQASRGHKFWSDAVIPQTANTEAFNLASISYSLSEAAMLSATPTDDPSDTVLSEPESWYHPGREQAPQMPPAIKILSRPRPRPAESGSMSAVTAQPPPWPSSKPAAPPASAAPRFRSIDEALGGSRREKHRRTRSRDSHGLYSPVREKHETNKPITPVAEHGSHSRGDIFPPESSHKTARKPTAADAASLHKASQKTSQRGTPAPAAYAPSQSSTEYYAAAMAQIDARYPPIPSPSLYSSRASSSRYTQSQRADHSGLAGRGASRTPQRPFETLRSAEARAEPVSWVDRWMPPPGTSPYQTHAPADTALTGRAGATAVYAGMRPGLNLVVPEFSNSTETLATPSMANPKTPAGAGGAGGGAGADSLVGMLHKARRHGGGQQQKYAGGGGDGVGVYSASSGAEMSASEGEAGRRHGGSSQKDGPSTPKAMVLVVENGKEVLREVAEPLILGGSHSVVI